MSNRERCHGQPELPSIQPGRSLGDRLEVEIIEDVQAECMRMWKAFAFGVTAKAIRAYTSASGSRGSCPAVTQPVDGNTRLVEHAASPAPASLTLSAAVLHAPS